ncbi:MAG: hypothetical protein MK102_18260, partial [Fuerstiella sp.]|nr:hypothetical protein [Fuerstiella sp.]
RLKDASHLIADHDTSFRALWSHVKASSETVIILLPPRGRNLNLLLERWLRILKSESLNPINFFGRRCLE